MIGPKDATFLVLSCSDVGEDVRNALRSAATALGHKRLPLFATVDECSNLELFVYEIDPWAVVLIDNEAIAAANQAFPSLNVAPDKPVEYAGYTFVAVPGFAACIDAPAAKRIAWKQLQDAKHPVVPW